MEQHPLVSVIVPAYNYAEYLPQAIDSALAQDWPSLEVIVVDDGSTDHTQEVLAAYGDRIRALAQPNSGVNAATGAGIGAARGEFLAFLDADDSWRPDRVRLLAEALMAHPEAGLVWGDMEIVDHAGRVTHPSFRRAHGMEPHAGRVLGRLLRGNFVSAGAMMVRGSLRHRYHPIPEVAAWQDWWIAVRVAEVSEVHTIEEPVNLYRWHDRNMNLGADAARLARLLRVELPFRRWLLENVPAGAATPEEWSLAIRGLDGALERVSEHTGEAPERLVRVGPDDLRRSALAAEEGRRALADGDPVQALGRLAAAIGAAPAQREPRMLLEQVLPLATGQADQAALGHQLVRGTVTFVLVDEIEADPGLLEEYGRGVSGEDDATLVVGGVDHHAAVARLQALITRAGMDSEEGADVLAVEARDPAGAAAAIGRPVSGRLERALAS